MQLILHHPLTQPPLQMAGHPVASDKPGPRSGQARLVSAAPIASSAPGENARTQHGVAAASSVMSSIRARFLGRSMPT